MAKFYMHRYEYKVIRAVSPEELQKKINDMAKKGWRCVNICPAASQYHGYNAALERDRIG